MRSTAHGTSAKDQHMGGTQAPVDTEHGRRLVLVDIENLLGGSGATASQVVQALGCLRASLGDTSHDVLKVACGPSMLTTAMGVLGNNVLLRRGVDGADRRLVEVIEDEPLGLFSSVALASGDAVAFAEPVRRLADQGVPTDVYVGRGGLGTSLRLAARSVTRLGRLHATVGEVMVAA